MWFSEAGAIGRFVVRHDGTFVSTNRIHIMDAT